MSDQPSITVAELAGRLGGTVKGDGARLIREIATLERAGESGVSWVGSPDFLDQALCSEAGVLLVQDDSALPADRTVIVVSDPDAAICEALACLAPPVNKVEPGIHPTAVVSPDAVVTGAAIGAHAFVGTEATVGSGTQLFPGTYVGPRARIGADCKLWPNVVVRERVTIGDRVVIHPNATIGADGFGYLQRDGENRKIPQIGTVVIEDDVEIGANTAIDRARSGVTRIGRGTKIDNLVQIGHNVDVGEHCIIVSGSAMGGSSSLGHHSVMAGHAGISDHRKVGDYVQVAAKSTVMKDLKDGETVRGIPARDARRFLREQASLAKLPEWMQRLRGMEKRIEQLERMLKKED
ncbi:MAG: UDP-3-O-(3-hydroxymyristoyl)glucosamine N-acyltransferase [Phycisphaerales bacterium]|nr:MAG: UDP-3-O-(3-hydroxymyristoyl)glucosamine N-acyltransferase [Phycisphaerales bacterium]